MHRPGERKSVTFFAMAAVMLASAFGAVADAGMGPHGSFLKGPWELVVKLGLEGEGLRYPIEVADETKPASIGETLPVMGTPIRIRVDRYIPELEWQTTAVKVDGGGVVAKLQLSGQGLDQTLWLSSAEPGKGAITASIGGVAVRKLSDADKAKQTLSKMVSNNGVGLIKVVDDNNVAIEEHIAAVGGTVIAGRARYKVDILKYVPHYTVDRDTKEVTSGSDEPVNPAILVSVNDGSKEYRQWLWSKFPTSPHTKSELPVKLRFVDFDLGKGRGRYIIAAATRQEPWLISKSNGKVKLQKAVTGKSYTFGNEAYSFTIEELYDGSVIETRWSNKAERLFRPALICTVIYEDTSQQAVLELGKPAHLKTAAGTMVLFYRRQPDSSSKKEHGEV